MPAPGEAGPDLVSRGGFATRAGARRLAPPTRRTTPCPVCRCTQVVLDQVEAGGPLHLAECPRCEHRWTSRAVVPPAAARGPVGRGRVAFVNASRLDAAAQA